MFLSSTTEFDSSGTYKDIKVSTDLHLDLLVEDKVIVDLKAKEKLSTIDTPKLLTYLRHSVKHLG